MAKARNTYKYHYKRGRKIIHSGITNDLERRGLAHQQKWPDGHIFQVGHKTTEVLDETLPDSKVLVMPGQQHIAMDTDMEMFVREVKKFLIE